jgi:hypothetical protein
MPPRTEEDRLAKMEENVAALSTSLAATREVLSERIETVKALVEGLANRPPPGVPVWVVLVMAVPPLITSVSLIVVALMVYTMLR